MAWCEVLKDGAGLLRARSAMVIAGHEMDLSNISVRSIRRGVHRGRHLFQHRDSFQLIIKFFVMKIIIMISNRISGRPICTGTLLSLIIRNAQLNKL